MGGDHQAGCCGCGGRGFDTRGFFLLRLQSSPFRGCCVFGLRFLRPGRLHGGSHYRLLGRFRDRLRRGIRFLIGGWSCGSLDDTPPSDDVIPPLAKVHLLGGGAAQLSFRSGRLACGDALSAAFRRLLCKIRLLFLPLHTATLVRCVVSLAATPMRFPWGRASTRDVGAPTCDAFALSVAKALAALALQWAFWSHIDSTDTRKPQSSVSDHTFDTSGPCATDTMNWGWEGGPWRGPDRSCVTP